MRYNLVAMRYNPRTDYWWAMFDWAQTPQGVDFWVKQHPEGCESTTREILPAGRAALIEMQAQYNEKGIQ